MLRYFLLICTFKIIYVDSTSVSLSNHLFSKPDTKREIKVTLNPGCGLPECNESSFKIVYARLQNSHDCLHYLFGFGNSSSPSLLLLKSVDPKSMVKIDWKKILFQSIADLGQAITVVTPVSKGHFEPAKMYSENSIALNKVIEYNDTSGKADYNNPSNVFFPAINLTLLDWRCNIKGSKVTIIGKSNKLHNSFSTNSSVQIVFEPYSDSGRSSVPPKLPHTSNTSDITVVLDHLRTRGKASRFSVELLMIGSNKHLLEEEAKESIDDEYAPTIFRLQGLLWKSSDLPKRTQIFSQWRKVCYKDQNTTVKYASATEIGASKDIKKHSEDFQAEVFNNRMLRGYYGESLATDQSAHSFVVTFGRMDDTLYNTTQYLLWTFSVGFGPPPFDTFSFLVITVLVISIALPLLIIVMGTLFMLQKRCRRRGYTKIDSNYQPIS